MKASGSGLMPGNLCKAASTSSVAASPSGSSPAASRFAFCLRSPPVRYEISSNSMSGAGDSETPSVSTSRSVRSPMGKSGGASSAASTAATSSLIVGGKNAE